jgi:FtsP/CotA-like multicopper oxidase with cupredoxin domain
VKRIFIAILIFIVMQFVTQCGMQLGAEFAAQRVTQLLTQVGALSGSRLGRQFAAQSDKQSGMQFGVQDAFGAQRHADVHGAEKRAGNCDRPAAGSAVAEPTDLRSKNGVLRVDLTIHNHAQADGSTRYCYVDANGNESPNLRLKPGDLLILRLKNDLKEIDQPANVSTGPAAGSSAGSAAGSPVGATGGPSASATSVAAASSLGGASAGTSARGAGDSRATVHDDPDVHTQMQMRAGKSGNECAGGAMTSTATNLHFHGLTIPPVCHQDDVMKTSIGPGDPAFEYRFRIPANEPPGLYWYHPHIHGFTKAQVIGGASGAIIIEGIERANKAVAGLPERVLIIRDQDLLNPNASPSKSEPVVPRLLIDRDGDAANNGTGFGKPAKDLSINYVPVPYPDYPPAKIEMKQGEKQLWRVLNASAITYLNLAVIFNRVPQPMGLVALDGVPLNESRSATGPIDWETHIGVPPGARVEFIIQGPPAGVTGFFVARTVDTGAGGENDPNRALATIKASDDAAEPRSTLAASPKPLAVPSLPWLGDVAPVRTRRLYFSEKLSDPNDPNSATTFYITVEGQTPAPFDPSSGVPNIVAKQGDVEDWIIENHSTELHAFHIHQIHFLLVEYMGKPVEEPFLRDTVNVPYYNGRSLVYPSVKVRMDFRDPNTVGDFVYHCHLLEHEDGGMMGLIRVEPAQQGVNRSTGRGTGLTAKKLSAHARPLCGAREAASSARGN